MTKYKSKIDIGLILIVFCIIAISTVPMFVPEIVWLGIVIDLTVILIFLNIIYGTAYIIEEDMLTIRCGIFINKTIDIHDIVEVNKTKDMQSSPALSFDRIRLKLKNKETVMISPKDRDGFINEICSINNKVCVHL